MEKLLKNHRSLSGQAEDIDTNEAYTELIGEIKNLSTEDLFDVLYHCETALKVLVREEAKGNCLGIEVTVEIIMGLCQKYLGEDIKVDTEYIYERGDDNGT